MHHSLVEKALDTYGDHFSNVKERHGTYLFYKRAGHTSNNCRFRLRTSIDPESGLVSTCVNDHDHSPDPGLVSGF